LLLEKKGFAKMFRVYFNGVVTLKNCFFSKTMQLYFNINFFLLFLVFRMNLDPAPTGGKSEDSARHTEAPKKNIFIFNNHV